MLILPFFWPLLFAKYFLKLRSVLSAAIVVKSWYNLSRLPTPAFQQQLWHISRFKFLSWERQDLIDDILYVDEICS